MISPICTTTGDRTTVVSNVIEIDEVPTNPIPIVQQSSCGKLNLLAPLLFSIIDLDLEHRETAL
jgi:hypothetical protein